MPVREVNWPELRAHVFEDDPNRPIRYTVLHHTWRPTAKDYKGLPTIEAIRSYHMRERGWRDIGYNCLVGPDGAIFVGRTLRSGRGAHCVARNHDSVGIAMVLNGDDPAEVAANKPMIDTAAKVAALYAQRFDVPPGRLVYHRDYAAKSCPGSAFLKHDEWRKRVAAYRLSLESPSEWAQTAWSWAVESGLLDGTRPRAPASREEVAVMLYRFVKLFTR